MKYNTLLAYVYDDNGEYDTVYCFEGSPENISNFILTHSLNRVVMTNIGDSFVLSSSVGGFLDRVQDQKFLVEKLHPVIIPKQQGEVEVVPIEFLLNEDGYYVEMKNELATNEFSLLGIVDSKYDKYGVPSLTVSIKGNKFEVLFPSSIDTSDIKPDSIISLSGYFMSDINNDTNTLMIATNRLYTTMNALLINDVYIDTLVFGKVSLFEDTLLYLSDINESGNLTFNIDNQEFLEEIKPAVERGSHVAIQTVPLFNAETGETELAIAQLSIMEPIQDLKGDCMVEQTHG